MPRFSAPVVILGIVLANVLAACGQAAGAAPSASPAAASPARPARPTFQLTITGGTAAGTYAADPAASLATCSTSSTGVRSLLYAGGDPWISIDLVLGAQVAEPGHGSDLALELSVRSDYLWIDTGGFRGGDAPGRSRAAVRVEPSAGNVRYVIDASTPYRTPDGDGLAATIALTLDCPA
jgi:hypothetical protein